MELRFVRRWFVERVSAPGQEDFIGKHRSVTRKTFKTVLQWKDDEFLGLPTKWQDVPTVDDQESLEQARKDFEVLR